MKRVIYLDGLRGLAALGVVFAHTDSFFNVALNDNGRFDTPSLAAPVYHFLFNGNFFVCIFFLLSGYVLLLSLAKRGHGDLCISATKRYFRLTPVICLSVALIYIIQRTVGFYNAQASDLIGGYKWLKDVAPQKFPVLETIWQAATVVFTGDSRMNGVLWSMKVEFIGSMMLFGFAAIFYSHPKYTLLASAAAAMLTIFAGDTGTYLALFLIGSLMMRNDNISIPFIFAIPAVYLGSIRPWYPEFLWAKSALGDGLAAPHLEAVIHAAGAVLLLLALRSSESAQRVLSTTMFRWLGDISFSLYLCHFMVFFSAGCGALVFFTEYFSVQNSAALAWVLTIVTSLVVAFVMTETVERPSIRWSDAIARKLLGIPIKKVSKPESSPDNGSGITPASIGLAAAE